MVVFQGEEYARASSCICWVEIKRNIINVGFRIYVLNIFTFFFLRGRHIHSFLICGEDIFSFVCVCVCGRHINRFFFYLWGRHIHSLVMFLRIIHENAPFPFKRNLSISIFVMWLIKNNTSCIN